MDYADIDGIDFPFREQAHKPPSGDFRRAEIAGNDSDPGAVDARDEGGHQAIRNSKPQSLAFALADSPAGLASWVVEKFRSWPDCEGDVYSVFTPEVLIDYLMLYWLID